MLLGLGPEDIPDLRRDLLALSEGGGSLTRGGLYDAGIIGRPEKLTEGILTIRKAEREGIWKSADGIGIDLDGDSVELLAGHLTLMERGERFSPEICELTVFHKQADATLILVQNP